MDEMVTKVTAIFWSLYRDMISYQKYINKNDNIHKNEVQDIRWSDEYWQV